MGPLKVQRAKRVKQNPAMNKPNLIKGLLWVITAALIKTVMTMLSPVLRRLVRHILAEVWKEKINICPLVKFPAC